MLAPFTRETEDDKRFVEIVKIAGGRDQRGRPVKATHLLGSGFDRCSGLSMTDVCKSEPNNETKSVHIQRTCVMMSSALRRK